MTAAQASAGLQTATATTTGRVLSQLSEPLAVIAWANLARFDDLLDRRRFRARQLADLFTGTPGIRLVAADRRPELAWSVSAPCRNAAAVIDRTLAVVLTDHDDEQRVTGYAQTISREVRRWNSKP
jgi:dTDP-4-amino-4,6-dideoxygalactose transaminase